MFEEQQRLNVELALKCDELAKSYAQSQARTFFLEDMLNLPHQSAEPSGQVLPRSCRCPPLRNDGFCLSRLSPAAATTSFVQLWDKRPLQSYTARCCFPRVWVQSLWVVAWDGSVLCRVREALCSVRLLVGARLEGAVCACRAQQHVYLCPPLPTCSVWAHPCTDHLPKHWYQHCRAHQPDYDMSSKAITKCPSLFCLTADPGLVSTPQGWVPLAGMQYPLPGVPLSTPQSTYSLGAP